MVERSKIISRYEDKLKIKVVEYNTIESTVIPQNTERIILDKLETFEKSTLYTDKKLSLKTLSSAMSTNTKYLSYVINKHKERNFNNYINELRISYIIVKFIEEPEYLNYSATKLAEESGFVSRTAFVTKFKEITGNTPSEYRAGL